MGYNMAIAVLVIIGILICMVRLARFKNKQSKELEQFNEATRSLEDLDNDLDSNRKDNENEDRSM